MSHSFLKTGVFRTRSPNPRFGDISKKLQQDIATCATFSSLSLKSIFHWSETGFVLGTQSREQEINNMKSICPTRNLPLHTQRELYSIGSHWVSCWAFLGLRWALFAQVGHYSLTIVVALGPQGFLDTNMLI